MNFLCQVHIIYVKKCFFFFFRKFVEISKELHLKQWFNWIETNNCVCPTVLLLDLIPNLIDIRDVVLEVNIVGGPKCVLYTITVEITKEHRCREVSVVIIQIFTQILYSAYRLLMTSVQRPRQTFTGLSYQTTATKDA